ncbi:MAG: phage/plasmid primase, P4 family [Lentisphaerota bacterium]
MQTEILNRIKVLDPVEGICELDGVKYNFSMYATYDGEQVKDPAINSAFDELNKQSTEKSLLEINKPIGKTAAAKAAARQQPDRRRITSKCNGKQGGREPIPVLQIAVGFDEFMKDQYDGAGLKFYRESWYKYLVGYFRELPETDFDAVLTKYIQDKFESEVPRISNSVLSDVTLNLKSSNLCFLPSDLQEPFNISGASSETDLFNMKNGLLNRVTMEIKPHTPDLFSTVQLPYDYRPDALCPRWLQYLQEVQAETPENIRLLKLMFGLCLIPETRFNIAFYLYGEGGTGKSVCLHVLTKLIGEHNICCIPLNRFGEKFGLYPLTTKLINVVGESPFQTKYNELAGAENTLKEVTDGGIIPVEQKMKNPFQAKVTARCIFATNNLPLFSDRSNGLWDRLRIISFKTRIRGTGQENQNLRYELEEELPGIFLWSLEGLRELQELQRFPDTPDGQAIRDEHRDICDHERVFLNEFYSFEIGCQRETRAVYEHYREWMKENGYNGMGEARFSQSVKRVFPKVFKQRNTGDWKVYFENMAKK